VSKIKRHRKAIKATPIGKPQPFKSAFGELSETQREQLTEILELIGKTYDTHKESIDVVACVAAILWDTGHWAEVMKIYGKPYVWARERDGVTDELKHI